MSYIRLKVQLNENKSSNDSYRKISTLPLKFVYILDLSLTQTVNDLRHSLEQYIIRQYAKTNVQIIRLMTDDGYYLCDDELCQYVLKDNERIICIDMESFIQENYSSLILDNFLCEIKQHDTSDNHEKYIQVGLNNSGKLFLRMHGSWNIYGLYLFNIFQLTKIANEKSENNLIARLSYQNWFIEAKWEYHSTSDSILYLICSLKLSSSEQIWSNKLHLSLDQSQMSIEKIAIDHLSGESIDENYLTEDKMKRLNELAANIPPSKQSGPELDLNEYIHKTINKHECQGDSSIRMAYGSTNTVRTYQDSYSSINGTFHQHFLITHINFFKSEINQSISVVHITMFYQSADQSWHECEDIAIAPIALRDEEPRWLADSIISIDSEKLVSYVIKGSITIKGEPGKDNFRRKRTHRTLPQPLKLQINIKDNFNKQSSLIVEQLNQPLNIDTLESFTKYNQSSIKNLLAFIYADDIDNEERIFLAMYLNEDNHLVINSNSTYSIILERKIIRTMEFNAKQKNTIEILFDSIYYYNDDHEKKAIALFDSQTFLLYAIRLEVMTKTSTSEQTVILPLDKIQ